MISLVDGEYNVNKLANDVYSHLQNENVNSSILTLNTNTSNYDNELSKKVCKRRKKFLKKHIYLK